MYVANSQLENASKITEFFNWKYLVHVKKSKMKQSWNNSMRYAALRHMVTVLKEVSSWECKMNLSYIFKAKWKWKKIIFLHLFCGFYDRLIISRTTPLRKHIFSRSFSKGNGVRSKQLGPLSTEIIHPVWINLSK